MDKPQIPVTNIFCSTRLTIAIFILLGCASIIGTIVIQKGSGEEAHISEVYSPVVIRIFTALDFFDIYHSVIYICLLFLLTLNLLFCSIRRLNLDLTRKKELDGNRFPDNIRKFKNSQELSIDGIPQDLETAVEESFKKHGMRLTHVSTNRWMAEKGEIGRYGFYISHLGFLIILFGGLKSALSSVEGMLWLVPGEKAETFISANGQETPLGFEVQCNDFRIDLYPNNRIKEYRSDLTFTPPNGNPVPFMLMVNHPFTMGGFRLYQSSYQSDSVKGADLEMIGDDGVVTPFTMNLDQEYESKTGDSKSRKIKIIGFEPDFYIGEGGRVSSRSSEMKNPALQVQISETDQSPRKQWLFLNFPDFHGKEKSSSTKLILKNVLTGYATGIQVVRDPGGIFIWIGSSVLVLGLLITIFVFHEKYWMQADWAENSVKIIVAGISAKNSALLEKLLPQMLLDIKTKLTVNKPKATEGREIKE